MKMYKFVSSAEAVMNMLCGRLKFTRVESLNDPAELLPIMDESVVRSSLDNLRKMGYKEDDLKYLSRQEALLTLLAPKMMAIAAPRTLGEANRIIRLPIYDDFDLMKRKLIETIKMIRSSVGVLSLSERYDSLPMWAHYAQNAKGFVVRFENLENEFLGDATGSLNVLRPVLYSNSISGMTFDPETQERLFFSKLSDWSYEREWRVILPLTQCKVDKGMHLREINPECVTGVFAGWHVSDADFLLLESEITKLRSQEILVRAKLDGARVFVDG
jgi:hypothetical protein